MSEQAREETLQAILSILDSIRPDAAEALRELVAEHKQQRLPSELNFSMPTKAHADAICDFFVWDETKQGHGYWFDVDQDFLDYWKAWFE